MDRFDFYSKLPRPEPGGVAFTNAYLTAVAVKATDRLCDIGCGAGDRASWIARSRGSRICRSASEASAVGASSAAIPSSASSVCSGRQQAERAYQCSGT